MARRSPTFDGGRNGSTVLVPKNHDELRAQVFDGILDASQNRVINDVAGHPDHKDVAWSLVKQQFRCDARIGAAHDDGARLLARSCRSATNKQHDRRARTN